MIKDERGREYEQNGAKDEQEVIDVETMEKVRYKLIAASYSYWLSTPRETSSTGHPQDRDHIGKCLPKKKLSNYAFTFDGISHNQLIMNDFCMINRYAI